MVVSFSTTMRTKISVSSTATATSPCRASTRPEELRFEHASDLHPRDPRDASTGMSKGYSAAQDVPGLDDFSCKKCVQVGELTCSRYHRLNQQDLYYFQSAPRDILALTFSRVQPSEPPDFCTCDQDIASSPSIPEARFSSKTQMMKLSCQGTPPG